MTHFILNLVIVSGRRVAFHRHLTKFPMGRNVYALRLDRKPRIASGLCFLGQSLYKLTRFQDLGANDQLRLLRQYLKTPDGQPSAFGVARMASVFRIRIRKNDLREIANVIHAVGMR